MILLDTHIWVRWQNAPETLPINILGWLAESDLWRLNSNIMKSGE